MQSETNSNRPSNPVDVKRILLLKPYKALRDHQDCPPLGLLYLVTALRRRFGEQVKISLVDLKRERLHLDWLEENFDEFDPDVVGVTAMNCEADVADAVAEIAKRRKPSALAVVGGPYAHNRGEEILASTRFDWTFNGEAESGFPEALSRYFEGVELGTDIPGLSYRHEGGCYISHDQDSIQDLDALGFPAWDMVDLDRYSRRNTMMNMIKGTRSATIFTSRGCPYLCSYCHDMFGRRFRHRSAEDVLAEIEVLHTEYGVDEIAIIDDIFNLHKPRLKKIMGEAKRRWGGRIHFCLPNGVRADLMDEETVEALHQGGTYAISVAIETATDRLQRLVEKRLDLEQVQKVIGYCDERGMVIRGFFMVGFPTETVEELKATVDFALKSRLTTAFFFTVIPQPATRLYEFAKSESAAALEGLVADRSALKNYRSDLCWYQRAYGFNMARFVQISYARFYLAPRRVWTILTRVPKQSLLEGLRKTMKYVFRLPDGTGGEDYGWRRSLRARTSYSKA